MQELKDKIASLPAVPGVYLMRDNRHQVIYVGKAKNLKSRVSSYFTKLTDFKVGLLMEKVEDVETILTATEYEALLLENSLIKRHNPKYNIDLKDGKSYPVIRITNEDFPRIFRTRHIIQDGSDYYGPFANVRAVDTYINLIQRLFPLRRCKVLKSRKNPCLYYHINKCPAPCIGNISKEEYSQHIKKVKILLSGRTVNFRKTLEKEMREAAERFDFEGAANLRDALNSLDILDSDAVVVDFNDEARDYISYAASARHVVFAVLQMRNGQVTDRQIYCSEYAGEQSEALTEFLLQYYSEKGHRPNSIFIAEMPDPLVLRFFNETEGGCPQIIVPQKKKDATALAMAQQNASEELERLIRKDGDIPALEELKRILGLQRVPHYIEGFDIAQLHGKQAVASLISFKDGIPYRSGYRHYKIRSTKGAVDDYRSIAEAIARRYQRLINEKLSLPDLILVDGGRGQVSATVKVLQALELEKKISCIGLSKKNEEIWRTDSDKPIRLPADDPCLRILQHLRDETHRFATSYSRKLRSRDMTMATLEGVPGIGPAKSAKLLTTYKSIEAIYDTSIQEIARTAGVAEEVAETVREFLGKALGSRKVARKVRDNRS